MPVRIESIRVKRGGPLKDDFGFEPGDLNLIYGPNESGKTYIVEALIGFLFKSGKRSGWELRDWSPSGRVVLSGIEEKPVDFTRSKAKLDDLWLADSGLPPDLSRMLVVRGGETGLSKGNGGVGLGVLKTFLSAERTLDRVEGNIPKSLRDASIEHGVIQANQTARKKRDELRTDLDGLDQLHELLDDDLDRGAIHSMEKRKVQLETEHKDLDMARRHRAYQLNEELTELRNREKILPTQKEIADAERDVWSRSEKLKEFEERSRELTDLQSASEESRWIRHATEVYSAAASRQEGRGGKILFLVLTILLLVATVTTGLLSMQVPLILCAVGSVIAMLLHHRLATHSDEDLADSMELAGIREDFMSRYGNPLSSIADLNAKAEELRERNVLAGETKRQVEDLEGVIAMLESSMGGFFSRYGLENRPPPEWSDSLTGLRATHNELETRSTAIEVELARLGIDRDDLLQESPPIPWNPDRYRSLLDEIAELTRELGDLQGKENTLKSTLANRTGREITDSWEDLRTALQDLRDQKAEEYRTVTADMLARISVLNAVKGFRVQERERMEQGLASKEMTTPLREITGHYTGLSLGDGAELILTTDDGESFPLDQLSTGAREQVHLALRTAFAKSVMDDTAFIVLDDAFQHSDWRRRERMVDYTLSLVKSGWQVFYFTMDDHMRDLFVDAGKALGDRFAKVDI